MKDRNLDFIEGKTDAKRQSSTSHFGKYSNKGCFDKTLKSSLLKKKGLTPNLYLEWSLKHKKYKNRQICTSILYLKKL